jgi:hypothetical protein
MDIFFRRGIAVFSCFTHFSYYFIITFSLALATQQNLMPPRAINRNDNGLARPKSTATAQNMREHEK